MKKNRKKFIALSKLIVLSFIVLFCLFPLVNTNTIVSSITKLFKADNVVELDNWEISTVFYDSTVNDGKTPLTEINWELKTVDPEYVESRDIIVQINYKNTNTTTNYDAGSLEITINSLFPNQKNLNNYLNSFYIISANDNYHSGYEWTVKTVENGDYGNSPSKIILTNENEIFKNTNFEGTIQLKYHFSTKAGNPEKYVTEKKYQFSDVVNCKLSSQNNVISSNDIFFNLNVVKTFNWKKVDYTLTKQANKIDYIDYLPNYSSYTWVVYKFIIKDGDYYINDKYPNVHGDEIYIEDYFDDNVIVLDSNYNKIEGNNGKYLLYNSNRRNADTYRFESIIIVGYPKSQFIEQNNTSITNSAKLYVKYPTEEDFEYVDEDEIELNLNNYEYKYNNLLYDIENHNNTSGSWSLSSRIFDASYDSTYYDALIGQDVDLGDKGIISYSMKPISTYLGEKYDLKLCDDFVYVSDSNGYKKLDVDEYYYNYISFPVLYDVYNKKVSSNKYKIKLYVKKGNEEYQLLDSFYNYSDENQIKEWFFDENDKISSFYFYIENLDISFKSLFNRNEILYNVVINKATDISENGYIYNFAYIEGYKNNEFFSSSNSIGYPSFSQINEIENYDINKFDHKQLRFGTKSIYKKYFVRNPGYRFHIKEKTTQLVNDNNIKAFIGKNMIEFNPLYSYSQRYNENEINNYLNTLDDSIRLKGYSIYELLPKGINVSSDAKSIKDSISFSYFVGFDFLKKDGTYLDYNLVQKYIEDSLEVNVINNYKNTGRTLLKIIIHYKEPIILLPNSAYKGSASISFYYNWRETYENVEEYGNTIDNIVRASYLDADTISYNDVFNCSINSGVYYKKDKGYINNDEDVDLDAVDINDNGNEEEYFGFYRNTTILDSIISSHQDVQVSVQTDKSNYDTGKVDTSNDSEYYYKLRARTGSNDVTNLVIYDSLEKYAKDPNMANVLASGGRGSWQGEFLGIDTSYAESKGYTVKTYYSENETPGSLKDDDSWKVYTDSVDKTKVKSLAFEYLDDNGNPAILPANSLTYVLIKMKSPTDENIKTLAYNGCWTEWNAIDPITGDKVDFITGINSNIVKVALPNSVEPVDIDFRVDKFWKDNNNEKKLRPDSVNLQVVPDGDVTQAIDVPLGSTNADDSDSNHWYTTIRVPKYDNNGNTIVYTVREDEILLDNGYKYTPEIEDTTITNRLMKEIKLKKIWKDNSNSELTRPSNITYKVKQNGNNYKDVVITGDYSTNEWNKIISVPVYDSSNNEYSYSIEEVNVNNYSSNCEEFSCTNTLVGTDSIHITKRWIDNNNSYDTRPDDVNVEILRNGTRYKTIQLTKDNNWEYSEEVSKYDDNGNRYSYSIEENKVDGYDLVTYNQNTYEITNTLKTNMNIVITKKWIDDNNNDNTRPSELVVTLLRNDENYKEVTLTGDSDIWTSIVEVPKYDDNQKEYKYSIKEINDDISDYYSDITYEDDLTVINKLNKNTDLTIKKKWIDHNNEYSSRPNEVNIKLFRNNEEYKSLKLSGNDNTWESIVKDVPMYDESGKKYIYTIEEDNIDKYSKVTYDQSNLEVTNELTEIPKVTLYFTVVNGYVDPKTGKMKYDEFGLNEILKKYNKTLEDEYIFEFKLENTDTHKIYDGKLSTKGVLEFKDIPYGEYKAIVGKDKLFEFVDMLSIKDVNGVSFKKIGNEGYISIKPTGDNIVFGAKIINKIVSPVNNPKTGINIIFIIAFVLLIPIIVSKMIVKNRKVLDSY